MTDALYYDVWSANHRALQSIAVAPNRWAMLHLCLAGWRGVAPPKPAPFEDNSENAALCTRLMVGGLCGGVSRHRDTSASLWRYAADAWCSWASGEDAPPSLAEAQQRASQHHDAPLVIELQVLRALLTDERGDGSGALELGRRAARMARTEALPQQEYLAYLVLARLRRRSGQPHLATRILSSLWRVVPPPYRRWLRWELLLAGAVPRANESQLDDALVAARQGERRGWARHIDRLRRSLASLIPFRREIDACESILDPQASADAWGSGKSEHVPFGMFMLGGGDNTSDAPISALVRVSPRDPPRRFLALGVTLDGEAVQIPRGHRRQGRLDIALAALALSGPDGVVPEALFEQAYGFKYEAAVHESTFRMTLMRARKHLGALGRIDRRDNRLVLTPEKPILLPDPRLRPPTVDRVLRVVAESKATSAKQTATALDLPLRRVQAELQRLVSEGVCSVQRERRGLVYTVEDTTFSDPTTERHQARFD
ncbi:MAG: hypothetical protein AAGF12_00530 [Myxococcota bacterium]